VLAGFYTPGVWREVLEREAELSLLAAAVRAAAGGAGSVVLLMGEAGIGKSSLVEALRAHLPAEGRMIAGYCDDLVTPRTLGGEHATRRGNRVPRIPVLHGG
jgi:MoxR-like ATPase